MAFAIIGAHCTGKTTLAKAIANVTKFPFVASSASAVFERMGLVADQPMSFADRMQVQEGLLEHFADTFKEQDGVFFTDRSPLDLIAYTLADLPKGRLLTDEEGQWLHNYMARCFDLTNTVFSGLMQLRPGIALVERDNKTTAPLCTGNIALIDTLLVGLLSNAKLGDMSRRQIRAGCTDLNDRMFACLRQVEDTLNDGALSMEGQVIH